MIRTLLPLVEGYMNVQEQCNPFFYRTTRQSNLTYIFQFNCRYIRGYLIWVQYDVAPSLLPLPNWLVPPYWSGINLFISQIKKTSELKFFGPHDRNSKNNCSNFHVSSLVSSRRVIAYIHSSDLFFVMTLCIFSFIFASSETQNNSPHPILTSPYSFSLYP